MHVIHSGIRHPSIETPQSPPAEHRILIDWTLALQDVGDLDGAVRQLARLLRAEAAVLVRRNNVEDAERILIASDQASAKRLTPRLRRSAAAAILGERMMSARLGSLWLHGPSDDLHGRHEWLNEWYRQRRIAQSAVVILRSDKRFCDLLELHFDRQLGGEPLQRLRAMAVSLAFGWNVRKPGCILSRYLGEGRQARAKPWGRPDARILDAANPAGLSRGEYRVCMLAGRGMAAGAIASQLGLTESTVRSHLRSIYSKTGTVGRLELMCRLHGTPVAHGGARAV